MKGQLVKSTLWEGGGPNSFVTTMMPFLNTFIRFTLLEGGRLLDHLMVEGKPSEIWLAASSAIGNRTGVGPSLMICIRNESVLRAENPTPDQKT